MHERYSQVVVGECQSFFRFRLLPKFPYLKSIDQIKKNYLLVELRLQESHWDRTESVSRDRYLTIKMIN